MNPKAELRFQYGRSKKNREFYWRIKAANGEVIAQGEGYKREKAVKRVFDLLKHGFDRDSVLVQELDENGKPVPVPFYAGTLVG